MRGTNCKIDCIFVDSHQNNEFHLESDKVVRTFIYSPTFVKKSNFFGEKVKNENLGCMYRETCINASTLGLNESLRHQLFSANRLTYVIFTFYRDPYGSQTWLDVKYVELYLMIQKGAVHVSSFMYLSFD